MSQQRQQGIQAEAIEWHVRLQVGGTEDWDAFIRWLEADPAHSGPMTESKFADAAIHPDMMPVMSITGGGEDDKRGPGMRGHGRSRPDRPAGDGARHGRGDLVAILVALPWLTAVRADMKSQRAAGERKTVELGDGSSGSAERKHAADPRSGRFPLCRAGGRRGDLHRPTRRRASVPGGRRRSPRARRRHDLQSRSRPRSLLRRGGRRRRRLRSRGRGRSLAAGQTSARPQRRPTRAGSTRAGGHDRLAAGPAQLRERRRSRRVASDLSRSLGTEVQARSGARRDAVHRLDPCRAGDAADASRRWPRRSDFGHAAPRSGWLIEPQPRATSLSRSPALIAAVHGGRTRRRPGDGAGRHSRRAAQRRADSARRAGRTHHRRERSGARRNPVATAARPDVPSRGAGPTAGGDRLSL